MIEKKIRWLKYSTVLYFFFCNDFAFLDGSFIAAAFFCFATTLRGFLVVETGAIGTSFIFFEESERLGAGDAAGPKENPDATAGA